MVLSPRRDICANYIYHFHFYYYCSHHFYSSYHSSREVGKRLILRLKREVSDDEIATLNSEFADIIKSGSIERIDATEPEIRDDDHVNLNRIAFHFNRHGYARLRVMINALNSV